VSWLKLYCLSLDLFSCLLRTLGHACLDQVLDVVGVHQERMLQALEMARVTLTKPVLEEAWATLDLLVQLSTFHTQWRFHLPQVMQRLMGAAMALMYTYIALLIRPRYLSHMLDGQSSRSAHVSQSVTSLQSQGSLEEEEAPSAHTLETEHRMLVMCSTVMTSLKPLCPPLYEAVLDQAVDSTQWGQLLALNFQTPGVDQGGEGLTFGTLLAALTLGLRQLAKQSTEVKHVSAGSSSKAVVHYMMENSLYLLMTQACRHLRDPQVTPRDRQWLKRELGTELNSFLSSYHRQLRRGTGERTSTVTPPHSGVTPPTPVTPQLSRSVSVTSFTGANDPAYIRLVQAFVQKVLR